MYIDTSELCDIYADQVDVVEPIFSSFGGVSNFYGKVTTVKCFENNGLIAEILEENGKHKDWACTEEMMSLTKDGKALYLHCLPADITGVSCEEGEVDATVFDRYRIPLYKEASYKPYVIAAMIFLSKFKNPVETLKELERKGTDRVQP